ncbi:hypothetical protein TNCV_2823141 [Trichonephila clavipes]|nr:hypothetical protein TNCV_2823141 [Trichonephila clavipes]
MSGVKLSFQETLYLLQNLTSESSDALTDDFQDEEAPANNPLVFPASASHPYYRLKPPSHDFSSPLLLPPVVYSRWYEWKRIQEEIFALRRSGHLQSDFYGVLTN